jgi:hypothetical protein
MRRFVGAILVVPGWPRMRLRPLSHPRLRRTLLPPAWPRRPVRQLRALRSADGRVGDGSPGGVPRPVLPRLGERPPAGPYRMERRDRHAMCKRLLRSAHAAVRHGAHRSLQNRRVRDERENPSIWRRRDACCLLGGQRRHDVHILTGKCFQRAAHQPAVVLELR